jgi:hypothetical protein
MFRTKAVEKIATHILRSTIFFSFQNRAVYEIMRKNMVEPDRLQMTIRPMRIASWIPKATGINSEYVILVPFPLQQWLHERASLLCSTYSTLPVSFNL